MGNGLDVVLHEVLYVS